MSDLQRLRERHPWPQTRPRHPFLDQGWLVESTRELLSRTIAARQPRLVLELGAWLGKSTRFILEQKLDVCVISVDIWDPAKLRDWIAAKHPHLSTVVEHCHEQFLANCWDSRDRIIPLKSTSLSAVREIADLGLRPDLIYLDTSHSYHDTRDELVAIDRIFPHAVLVGDDWLWRAPKGRDGPVARAVREHHEARRGLLRLDVHGNGWRLTPIRG